jgi:hypothetical protein
LKGLPQSAGDRAIPALDLIVARSDSLLGNLTGGIGVENIEHWMFLQKIVAARIEMLRFSNRTGSVRSNSLLRVSAASVRPVFFRYTMAAPGKCMPATGYAMSPELM